MPDHAPIAQTVSVVMPAFNAANTIVEAIESVLGQSHTDFELIVVDDGSTDATAAAVRSIRDPRLTVLTVANAGPAAARNRGIEAANGQFVAFLDADDIWLPDKLAAQVAALNERPSAGAVFGFVDAVDWEGDGRRPLVHQPAEGWILETLLVWNVIGNGSNLLVRRSALEESGVFNESLKGAEDWELSIRLARRWEFVCVRRALSLYRQGTGTLSSRLRSMECHYRRALPLAYSNAPSGLQRLRPLSLSVFYHYLAVKAWAMGIGRVPVALVYSAKAIFYAELAQAHSVQPTFYPFADPRTIAGVVSPTRAVWRTLFPAFRGW